MEKRPTPPHRKIFEDYERALVGILALAVLALAGLALWLYLSGKSPTDDSPEAGFARDMMVHHAQAVQMAEIVQNKTTSDDIRILAMDIALTQQAQIGIMQGWLGAWGGLPIAGSGPAMAWMGHPMDGPMPGMATPEELDRLSELPSDKADELFLRLMIPHHEAAIPMARAIIERSDQPEVVLFAKKVIAAQQAEIKNMQQMLKAMGAPPVEEQPSMDGMEMGAGSDHK